MHKKNNAIRTKTYSLKPADKDETNLEENPRQAKAPFCDLE